ncbi:MAG: peptidyl-prolyl cis-trans isomerase B (cyclophilin B), partial [Elusimicrobia bacterium]
ASPAGSPQHEEVTRTLRGYPQFLDAPRVFKPLLSPATVVFETEKGGFVIRLSTRAANHAGAFAESVAAGLYDGTEWHRVVTGFVVQGGDPRGSGWGDAGWRLADEAGEPHFTRGTVGMPKAGPDTGGCQLFVSLVPTPHLDGRYTAFGQVVEGLDVLDRLEPADRILKATLRRR